MTVPSDDAGWLVLADQLSQEGHPLGEYLVLALKYENEKPPETKRRRMRKLVREWEGRFKGAAKFGAWYRTRLIVRFKDAKSVLKPAAELKRVRMPLELEVGDGRNSTERCFFDAEFERLAWMVSTQSVENQNHSPGMDETWSHWRDVTVFRVSDKTVLLKRGAEAQWWSVEFRADGVYGVDGSKADKIG